MRRLLMATFAEFCPAATAIPTPAADDRDPTVANRTGHAIRFIGVNPPADDNFDATELDGLVVEGGTAAIKFGAGDGRRTWVMVIA